MPAKSRPTILVLSATLLFLLLFFFLMSNYSSYLQSLPGPPWLYILVGVGVVCVNIALTVYTALQSRNLPPFIRALPVIAATLFAVGFGAMLVDTIALAQGQQPVFNVPIWFFFIILIFSQSVQLIERYWEQPNKQAWLRVTRAAVIGGVAFVALLFLYISIMSIR